MKMKEMNTNEMIKLNIKKCVGGDVVIYEEESGHIVTLAGL